MSGLEQDATQDPARDDIEQRILDATIALAIEGGYDAVRQRDVAARANVALGTLYARFQGKNELLAAALHEYSLGFVGELRGRTLRGRTPLSRVSKCFEQLTERVLEHPHLTRASLRAATSGDHAASLRMLHSQAALLELVVEALRGKSRPRAMRHEVAQRVATVLVMVWFANLTAWAGGISDQTLVVEVVKHSADMLLHGVLPRD